MASKAIKVLVKEVQDSKSAWQEYLREESMSNGARYQELTGRNGLVHQAQDRYEEARRALQKRLTKLSGLPAYMLKEMF